MRSLATIEFIGWFETDHFAEFIDHRARRLDLDMRVEAADDHHFSLCVSGEPDLIDAFEMACSLGPLDCLVIDVIRHDEPADAKGAMPDV